MSPRPAIPTSKGTTKALAALAGLAALKAAALVLLMSALAHALSTWAGGAPADYTKLLVQGSLGAVLLAGSIWGQQVMARRAALGTKEELRSKLVSHRLTGGGKPGVTGGTGAEAVMASRGLDGLDSYFTAYLPALVSCAVLPPLLLVQILITDWVSALVVVLTLPLVPVFMILIGLHTEERIGAAAAGLDRLSNNLLELAKGLPVLVGLRRAGAQRQALADVSERYRKSTMATLKTAFLSAMALELISTISVAIVAVFIGIRLVYGQMPLEAGLLALMLAPECFRPLREVGAAHHASEDGVEALRRVNEILDGMPADDDKEVRESQAFERTAAPAEAVLVARELNVCYADRSDPALANFSANLAHGEFLVLDGASGSGKSTALGVFAGVIEPSAGVQLRGTLEIVPAESIVWVSQHPVFTEDTIAQELAIYAAGPEGIFVDAATVSSALEKVNALHLAQRSPLECSPGELRRVAVARALARIANDPGVELALFDEPTAHLDPVSAAAVRAAILELAGRVAAVVATHDPALQTPHSSVAQTLMAAKENGEAVTVAETKSWDNAGSAQDAKEGTATFQWRWLKRLPLLSPRFISGVLVSALATLAAAALAGVSAWLIVWAAQHPPMMYLMTLIVGVRAFGIGRSVLRYSERLLTHNAVLVWANTLRLDLWDALGSNVKYWGRLTRSGGSIGTLVADVDELRDALPRAVVPIPAAILSYGAVLLTTILMAPAATWAVVAMGVLALLVIPALVFWANNRAATAAASHRSWLASRLTTLFAASDQLRANGVAAGQSKAFSTKDQKIAAPLRRLAWSNGFGQGAVSLLTSVGAVVVAALAIAAGTDPRAAAVAALLMLALAEPFGQYIEAVEQFPVLKSMMIRTMPILDQQQGEKNAPADSKNAGHEHVDELHLNHVTAAYPNTNRSVFEDLSGGVTRGKWWSVSGPSGSGKSTLLAVLLGFLQPTKGSYTINHSAPSEASLAQIAWCPQESYLFNSTLRSNLALAKPSTQAPSDEELKRVLETVGLGPWFSTLTDGLETKVGPGGHHLSGGQRTRVSVARTLVAGADVVLLDEPTAHLGADEASALIADLKNALAETAVVLVTHDAELALAGDSRLDLGKLEETRGGLNADRVKSGV